MRTQEQWSTTSRPRTLPERGIPDHEVDELKDMVSYLARQHRSSRLGERLAAIPEQALDSRMVQKLHSAMRRLLGGPMLREQRECALITPHDRGQICDHCGYSDNLYLQELERILRRIRRAAAAARSD